jgi:hypothetical protein
VTRYRLIRLAQISAGVLGTLLLGAGIRRLGIPATLGVAAFCVLAGAAASLGWHGVAVGFARHEERLQAERRHRAPRPDREQRRQAGAELEPEPAPAVDGTPAAAADPYAEQYRVRSDDEWFGIDRDGLWFGPAQDSRARPAARA